MLPDLLIIPSILCFLSQFPQHLFFLMFQMFFDFGFNSFRGTRSDAFLKFKHIVTTASSSVRSLVTLQRNTLDPNFAIVVFSFLSRSRLQWRFSQLYSQRMSVLVNMILQLLKISFAFLSVSPSTSPKFSNFWRICTRNSVISSLISHRIFSYILSGPQAFSLLHLQRAQQSCWKEHK